MLSNNAFMILAIIHELKSISGYRLNQIIENRGYRAWADLGTTTIYVSLKSMVKAGLIEGSIDAFKSTQGPSSVLYNCTPNGITALRNEVRYALEHSREHNRRFDLALSTIDILTLSEIQQSLASRVLMLESQKAGIEAARTKQNDSISFQGVLLFERTLHFIHHEIEYTNNLIKTITKEWNKNDSKRF